MFVQCPVRICRHERKPNKEEETIRNFFAKQEDINFLLLQDWIRDIKTQKKKK